MNRVENKIVLITGGAGGIGGATSRRLYSEGAFIVIAGNSSVEAGEALARELGDRAMYIRLDVTKRDSWIAALEKTEKQFGPVQVLVNNAGVSDGGYIHELPIDIYKKVIEVNQVAVFLGMQTVYPYMRKIQGGSIINVSSVYGIVSDVHSLAYVASKWAVRGMTKVAAVEYGRFGIRVNSVYPGLIRTPMTANVESDDAFGYIPLAKRANAPDKAGMPEDIANMMLFLASDESSFVNGAEIVVDGGLILNRETLAKEKFFTAIN
jgi:3alpha(or 20beta)-hydroxysteroid dehydrogenase